jgi:putative heme-binding domain-containing protein
MTGQPGYNNTNREPSSKSDSASFKLKHTMRIASNPSLKSLFTITVAVLVGMSCNNVKDSTSEEANANPKISKIKLPADFHAEHLYSPSNEGLGSWVSMTFDDKGRMIVSDQYGALYRLELPPIGDTAKPKIEKLDIIELGGQDTSKPKVSMGYAQGLLYAFNSLYVMVNHGSNDDFKKGSGLYRLQDTNGDDKFDKITLLKGLEGEGEHGPHSVVLSPDKKSIYVVAGNFTKIPAMDAYRATPVWQIDNILPLLRDPNGHDNTVETHGGWIARTDSAGKSWELVSSGYRNPFDMAFNDEGDLFTYDSDMEWDFGTPWYRPTRICHVTSGSEFGWRPGTDKWSARYPDNLPPVLNIGQGCPTNFIAGGNAKFPEKYRKSLFAFDWSFGIIYAIHLEADGSSYKAGAEEFLSGTPLPLTDGAIGPDGAMYFLTGGRRLESDLYRITYKGKDAASGNLPVATLSEEQKIRRQLEEYHGAPQAGAVDFVWPYLKHSDRFIRFAARIALEHQPIAQWQERAFNEKDPIIITNAMLAVARHGTPNMKSQALKALLTVDYGKLSESQQIDVLRAIELVCARFGEPDAATKTQLAAFLNPHYPANNNDLNRSMSKLVLYLDAPEAVSKTMALLATAKDDPAGDHNAMESSELILRNPQYGMDIANMLSKMPPLQQTYYAVALSAAKNGWTPELREQYFQWFYKAFGFKGGYSFVGFIDNARKNALNNAPKADFAHFNAISGDSLVSTSRNNTVLGAVQPKGPGRGWNVDEALAIVEKGEGTRSFEQGKAMFTASLCGACHGMRGEGGTAGPDLTQLGTRFSTKDILEAIIDPSKTISDQYGATVFNLKAGGSVIGRLVKDDKDKYYVSQNPFAPQVLKEVLKKDVKGTSVSTISPMLPGLINRLNPEELKDLIAYLKSGGNAKDTVFVAKQ